MRSPDRARVSLRPARAEDVTFVLASEQAEDNRPFIHPWTREQHLVALCDPGILHLLIVSRETRLPLGFAILAGLDDPEGAVELRRLVVNEKGRGTGRAALRMIQKLAFRQLAAQRLWLDVLTGNARAKALYESEGFVVEGVLRECRQGTMGIVSLEVMSLLRDEYDRRDESSKQRAPRRPQPTAAGGP